MIDENGNYVTKSKLTITVKTFSKYNDKSRVAAKQANKQTQRHTHKKKYILSGRKAKKQYLQIDSQADLKWTNAHIEVNKK